MNETIDLVCRYYGVDRENVLGGRRHRPVALARQVIVYLERKRGRSVIEISKTLGFYHSYCAYCIRSVQDLMEAYPDFRSEVEGFLRSQKEGRAA